MRFRNLQLKITDVNCPLACENRALLGFHLACDYYPGKHPRPTHEELSPRTTHAHAHAHTTGLQPLPSLEPRAPSDTCSSTSSSLQPPLPRQASSGSDVVRRPPPPPLPASFGSGVETASTRPLPALCRPVALVPSVEP
jgi:hypothetical protein